MKQDTNHYSLNLRSGGGNGYPVSPYRADGEELHAWWHEFLKSGEAPSLRDVTSGLGWDISRVRRALKYLVIRRGWGTLPGAERLRDDLHRARYRWGGTTKAWASPGSPEWIAFFYHCKTCGGPTYSLPRYTCRACRDAARWVTLKDVHLDVADDAPGADELLAARDIRPVVEAMLAEISPRDAQVLRCLYGLDGEAQTQVELAPSLGVTHQRVQQIEAKALAMLRKRFAHLRGRI